MRPERRTHSNRSPPMQQPNRTDAVRRNQPSTTKPTSRNHPFSPPLAYIPKFSGVDFAVFLIFNPLGVPEFSYSPYLCIHGAITIKTEDNYVQRRFQRTPPG